jgi:hypothetical protein
MTMETMRRPAAAVRCALAAALGVAALAATPAHSAPSSQPGVFDGYGAFYDTLPNRLFDRLDAKPMTAVGGDPDHPRATWKGNVPGVKGEQQIDLRETTPVVNGVSLSARPESTFPGATTVALGDQAKLYVNDRALCFEGTPAAGSGTADRYVQVTLVLLPFEKTARRYELPRLFSSCLDVTQEDGQPVRFLAAALRPAGASSDAQGVDFTSWTIAADGSLRRGTDVVKATFVDPGNVFRFKLD